MKSFKQYITEVVSFRNNSLWASSKEKGFEIKKPRRHEYLWDLDFHHPKMFPHLNFSVIGDPKPKTGIDKIPANSWGRVDHDNKVVHIVTQNGNIVPDQSLRGKKLEDDVFARLGAVEHLRERFPDYRIHVGHANKNHRYDEMADDGKPENITTHGYSEHEKYLTGLLRQP